jgi:hypothetical protein
MEDDERTLIALTKTRVCGGFVDKETKINDTHAYLDRNFFSAMVMLPSYDPLRLPHKAC